MLDSLLQEEVEATLPHLVLQKRIRKGYGAEEECRRSKRRTTRGGSADRVPSLAGSPLGDGKGG